MVVYREHIYVLPKIRYDRVLTGTKLMGLNNGSWHKVVNLMHVLFDNI